MDLTKIKNIYFVGIEGAGTSALAQLIKHMGAEVMGSDEGDHAFRGVLEENQIKVLEKFSVDNITDDVDLFINSTAYGENNIEVAEIKRKNLKLLSYPEALGEYLNSKHSIAVAGTHGKTTTTGWLAYVLDRADKSPSALVGSVVPQFDSNILKGYSGYFVFEADEYQNKLQYYHPKMALINNVDYDHPDYFKTKEEYLNVFIDFVKKMPASAMLILNYDDENIKRYLPANTKSNIISYSINNEEANLIASNIRFQNGKQYFEVSMRMDVDDERGTLGEFAIGLSGVHNIYNALAVIAACVELDVELQVIRKHLDDYEGTRRRMQVMGKYRGATIVDDYAHHPTEIKASVDALRQKYPNEYIRIFFHPHTFTRTKALIDDFAASFVGINEVVILDIYGSAREQSGGVSSEDLVEKIIEHNKENNVEQEVRHVPTLDDALVYIKEEVGKNDIVVLMGAGDVNSVGEKLLK